jgi:hypothetical protein
MEQRFLIRNEEKKNILKMPSYGKAHIPEQKEKNKLT